MQKVNQAYVQAKFTTAGQGEILLLLYDGALKFLTQAKEKMLAKDYVSKGNLISKALDVISELDGSLNKEVGGDLAQNLHQLYFLCSTKLLQANLRMQPELIDTVVDILSGLRSAYAQILTKPEAQAAASQIASKQSLSGGTAARSTPIPAVIPSFSTGMGRSHAQAAYGQQHTATGFGLPGAGAMPQAAQPVPLAKPGFTVAPGAPTAATPATPAPVVPAPVVPAPVVAQPAPVVPAASVAPLAPLAPLAPVVPVVPVVPAPPVAPVAPAPPLAPAPPAAAAAAAPLNLENRRLAASARYGKMAGI